MNIKLTIDDVIIDKMDPEDIHNVVIHWDIPEDRSQLIPELTVQGRKFKDNVVDFSKIPSGNVDVVIKLLNRRGVAIHTYHKMFKFFVACSFGDEAHLAIYKENAELKQKIKELEEKGEII